MAEAVAYLKSAVERVLDDAAALTAQAAGGVLAGDSHGQLHAFLPGDGPAAGGARPLVGTGRTPVTFADRVWKVTSVAGGRVPAGADQTACTLAWSYAERPGADAAPGARTPGTLVVDFSLLEGDWPPGRFQFEITPTRIVPVAPPALGGELPEGFWDTFKCILKSASNALLPAITASLPTLAAGPEAFLPVVAGAAGAQLPAAFAGAVGCVTALEDDAAGWEIVSFPERRVRTVIRQAPAPAAPPGRILLDPIEERVVCADASGLYAFTGALGGAGGDPTSAHGRLTGDAAMMGADVTFDVAVGNQVDVTLQYQAPVSQIPIAFHYDRDGRPLGPPTVRAGDPGAFDLSCLIAASSGPLLQLVVDCLPKLRQGQVQEFLRAMLDGAGGAVGTALTGVVRQCVGGAAPQGSTRERKATA